MFGYYISFDIMCVLLPHFFPYHPRLSLPSAEGKKKKKQLATLVKILFLMEASAF